jgi:hypothetical protein
MLWLNNNLPLIPKIKVIYNLMTNLVKIVINKLRRNKIKNNNNPLKILGRVYKVKSRSLKIEIKMIKRNNYKQKMINRKNNSKEIQKF